MTTNLQRFNHDGGNRAAGAAEEGPDLAPPVDALHHTLQVFGIVVRGVLESFQAVTEWFRRLYVACFSRIGWAGSW